MLDVRELSWKIHVLAGAFISIVAFGALAEQTETVRVEDPRPIWAAVVKMSKMYGYTITYEDPIPVYSGDVHDIEETRGEVHDPSKPHFLVARRGSLTFTYSVDAKTGVPNATKVFNNIVKAGEQAGYHFRFVEKDGIFHFVPTSSRDANGVQRPYRPLLDKRITILPGDRTLIALILELCKEVAKDTDVSIEPGTMSLNTVFKTKVEDGADRQVAGEFLSKVLGKHFLTWNLLCLPNRHCYLNLKGVMPHDVAAAPTY